MQVNKRELKIGKAVFEGDIKSEAEGSIIVPDVKPDILKILQADAEAFLTEKQADEGKIIIKGKVKVDILYVPENGDNSLQCINGCFEFCETLKKSEFENGMSICACCDTEEVKYKVINSRKVGISAKISIGVQTFGEHNISFVEEIENENAEVRYKNMNVTGIGVCGEFGFSAEETVGLPKEKGQVNEILKSSVTVGEKEYKALRDKLVLKGRANASILYSDDNNECRYFELELPFTEVFDLPGLLEDSECEIILRTGENSAKKADDGNTVTVSSDFSVYVKSEKNEEIRFVSDCYFTDSICDILSENLNIEEVASRPVFKTVIKELIQKEENAPEIMSVYAADAKPYITSYQIQNNRIAVSGKMVIYVLYMTENPEVPVCGINEELPFAYMLDCDNISGGDEVLLSAECEHTGYAISSSNAVEVRCGLEISGRVVRKSDSLVITDVQTYPPEKTDSGIVIYFVQKGEEIWDIAKRYRVSCKSILSSNGLDEGSKPTAGEKLIIPMMNV